METSGRSHQRWKVLELAQSCIIGKLQSREIPIFYKDVHFQNVAFVRNVRISRRRTPLETCKSVSFCNFLISGAHAILQSYEHAIT